jgi:hypothetical protein
MWQVVLSTILRTRLAAAGRRFLFVFSMRLLLPFADTVLSSSSPRSRLSAAVTFVLVRGTAAASSCARSLLLLAGASSCFVSAFLFVPDQRTNPSA